MNTHRLTQPQRLHPILSVALLALCALGCGTDKAGMPQPFPLPAPNLSLLRYSGAALAGQETDVAIVGLANAVSGAGTVTVMRAGQPSTTRSTEKGSFFVQVKAQGNETLDLRFESSAAVAITVPVLGVQTPRPPHELSGVPPITGPVNGIVTVRGEDFAGTQLMVVNISRGDVGTGQTDPSGQFTLAVPADHGHTLRVYDNEPTIGRFWELQVP